MHFDDGVIEIDHDGAVDPGQHRGVFMQSRQHPGGHSVELSNMAEGEFPQE